MSQYIDKRTVGVFKVVDGSLPLAGVLLSLSGSGNYRQNNVTPDSGIMQFTGLVRLVADYSPRSEDV